MATVFLNGYATPEMDETLLADYPYQLLEPNQNSLYEYTFRGAKSPWFVWYNTTYSRYQIDCADAENFFCRLVIADNAWDAAKVYSVSPWQLNDGIYWSSHDITMGTEDGPGTEIYIAGTDMLPAAEVGSAEAYVITKERLAGLADQIRRITGSEAAMTPAEMQTALEGIDM